MCPAGLKERDPRSNAFMPMFKASMPHLDALLRLPNVFDLKSEPSPPWRDEIDYCHYEQSSGWYVETTFYVKRYKTITMADMAYARMHDEGNIKNFIWRFLFSCLMWVSVEMYEKAST